MTRDLRQAVRFLARHRGYALIGILTVAVGVGVNAAMFSVSDSVLFRPLPYANADRLFFLSLALLNQRAARMLFPDRPAVGQQITGGDRVTRTIVGIVEGWRRSLTKPADAAMYVPFTPSRFRMATIVTDAPDTPAVRQQISAALRTLEPRARIDVEPLDRLLDREIEPYRFNMRLVSLFGALALGLVALGIYGVLSILTAERRREYGIRVALGATRHRLRMLVLRQAALPIAVGLAAGLSAASALSRLVARFLYHVAPLDSTSYIGAAALVLLAGLFAALVPALRAGRVDPIAVLKAE